MSISVSKKWLPCFRTETWEEVKIKRSMKLARKTGKKRAGQLARNPTGSELKCMIAFGKLGIVFEFQKPIIFQSQPHYRILDFFIPEKFIAIEIDGSGHFTEEGIMRDRKRMSQFHSEYPHFRFFRFTNEEANKGQFFQKLKSAIDSVG